MNVHLKDFPSELHREAKIQAAVEEITLKAIVIKALDQYLKTAKKKSR